MVFALLLFGCPDDGSQCDQLSQAPKHYEAKVLCEADADRALQSDTALRANYPTVEARCMPIGADADVAFSSGDPTEGQAVATIRLAMSQPRPR